MADSDPESLVSMDESSNSGSEDVKSEDRSSSSKNSSSENDTSKDSSRSGASTPESNEGDSMSDESENPLANFVPFKVQKPLLTLEELKSSEYDFWTVSVPRNLNPSKLHDLVLSLSKSTRFSINKEKYETILKPEKEDLTFLIPNKQGAFELMPKTISGHLAIVEDVGVPDQDENQFLKSKTTSELPQNLKRRHPIYGHGFEPVAAKKVKKAKKTKKETVETPMPVKEKKKKRKKSEQC